MVKVVAREGEGGTAGPCPAARPLDASGATGADGEVERLRRSIVRTRAKICTLQEREGLGQLPPTATAKLAGLRREAEELWQELRRVLREEVPSSDDP
jgi:hypothetical protein